jgi:L-lysine 2,3-aminomutase
MNAVGTAGRSVAVDQKIGATVSRADVAAMMDRYGFSAEMREIVAADNLLPSGVLSRIHATYPQHSGLLEKAPMLFKGRAQYEGLKGFREVCKVLEQHGIHLSDLAERELFVEVYRFKATEHALNTINWCNYQTDSMFQLIFPQPGMVRPDIVKAYLAETDPARRTELALDYVRHTNPHDGHQLLNKPWIERDDGGIDIVQGSQHKYPQTQLIFDKTTQQCFAFCTYCFRHAQVRGDEDMFLQEDVAQVHAYVRQHPEITDLLITGGDAGYLTANRLRQYVMPIIEDPSLIHVRTIRIGSRMLTYEPERILTRSYDKMLELFDQIHENGLQLTWMAHFSTPREILNPSTIAAIRRLQKHGVTVRSQSPIMHHISLFTDDNGKVDVDRSAQNWIDLGNLLGTLGVRFHSMYCARATGEHHYFTAPLADIDRIFSKIFRSLSSINRPSRYITMTTSAGKLSIIGTSYIGGQKVFALKFNESRNMEWMDRVFFAKFDEKESRVDFLTPFEPGQFFFEGELKEIEKKLEEVHKKHQTGGCCD